MTASKIEWTERSDWNPVRGCTRVSEGCRHCYAEQIAGRFSDPGQPFHGFATRTSAGGRWTGRVELVEDRLTRPLKWRKPALVFASSTSDIFHESLPDAAIDRIFAVMALSPRHTFQVLTKRAERMRAYMTAFEDRPEPFGEALASVVRAAGLPKQAGLDAIDDMLWPLPNLWLGVSVEDQAAADARVPHLLATPAAKRFLSCEPLLGQVDLEPESLCPPAFIGHMPTIDWVIAGGESGRGARPRHPDWARSLRDQCAAAGVPFFDKQWGEWLPRGQTDAEGWWWPDSSAPSTAFKHEEKLIDGCVFVRIGKVRAGRLLDGVKHDGMPA